jgi:hypothetical protein
VYNPNPSQQAVEQVIRDLVADNPDLPIRADFYRGINQDRYSSPFADAILREYVSTPGCPWEWFVRVSPTDTDVMVSAAGRGFLGVHDTIGEVASVKLPQTSPGEVDIQALSDSRFHVEMLAAVREKAAVVAEMRAAITS